MGIVATGTPRAILLEVAHGFLRKWMFNGLTWIEHGLNMDGTWIDAESKWIQVDKMV